MADIILFHFEQSEIRYVGDGVNHEWVAQDVCRALGIKDTSDALSRLDEDEKGEVLTGTPGGEQKMLTVNEPGLYTLVLGSRKPVAKRFKRWIAHEVIPSIRETGGYSLDKDKATLERQYRPTPTKKDLREGHGLYKLMYGKAYADRWLQAKVGIFYPQLGPEEDPRPEEKASLPTARALLTPTQIAEELGVLYRSGKGNAIAINKLLQELGYQEKAGGQWSATEKAIAANLCDRKPVDTNSRTQRDQLLWSADILPVLREHVVSRHG